VSESSGEEVSDLTATAISMAAQHGELVSKEVIEAAVANIEKDRQVDE
jgi:hypothetical protein